MLERFWAKVQKTKKCWIWMAATGHFGYGQFWVKERQAMVEAHIVSWQLNRGKVPKGLCVLHKCDNPACVRPSHLYLGTKKDNAVDRRDRKRHWKDRDPKSFYEHQRRISMNGKSPGNRKLNPDQVRLILSSDCSNSVLAKKFGLNSPETVRLIKNRTTWRHINA